MKRQMVNRTLDIEDLLSWTYRQQLADIVLDRGYGLHPIERQADGIPVRRASTDGVLACMRSKAIGTSSAAGAAPIKADLHPDAERVHNTVMMLGGDDALLIIRHAKAADRPNWYPDARHRCEPVWKGGPKFDSETGLPMKGSFEIETKWDRNRHKIASGCPIIEIDAPDRVAAKRELYRRWRRALVTLANYFDEAPLTEHIVTGPTAPENPWLGRDAGHSSRKIAARY